MQCVWRGGNRTTWLQSHREAWEPRLQREAGAGRGSPQTVGSELGLKSGSREPGRVVEQKVCCESSRTEGEYFWHQMVPIIQNWGQCTFSLNPSVIPQDTSMVWLPQENKVLLDFFFFFCPHCRACRILQDRTQTPRSESAVLTTGPPGNSLV